MNIDSATADWLLNLALLALGLFTCETLVVSLLLRGWHRREVRRLMAETARQDDGPPPRIVYDRPAARLSPGALELSRRVRGGRLSAAFAYGLAGLLHALITLAASFYSDGMPDLSLGAIMLVICSWSVVWTLGQVLAARRLTLLVCGLVTAAALVLAAGEYRWFVLYIWLTLQGPPLFMQLMVANRMLKAVGVPVLIPVSVFTAGTAAACAAWFLPVAAGYRIALAAGAQLVFTLAAWLEWKRLVGRYKRGETNEQSMLLDTYWLLMTEWLFVLMVADGLSTGGIGAATLGGLWAAAAFGVYLLVKRVGFRVLRRRAGGRNVRLLLLRVFGSRSRGAGLGERLLDELGRHWRYAGSILLIAGADLAASTLEPHEIMELVSGRLKKLFISGPEDLPARLGELDAPPDRDGRFRVHEFFCHADAWEAAFERLLGQTDVVLMDLRGLTPENRGVLRELAHLFKTFPVGRVILISDSRTDRAYFESKARELWAAASRDSGAASDALNVVTVERQSRREFKRLLARLYEAAQGAPAK